MTKDEALKMAIEWVEGWKGIAPSKIELLRVLREALEQPAQEPYGWYDNHDIHTEKQSDESIALYTHPHQWQGLTDDEIVKAFNLCDWMNEPITEFARAIEQALKEKNT